MTTQLSTKYNSAPNFPERASMIHKKVVLAMSAPKMMDVNIQDLTTSLQAEVSVVCAARGMQSIDTAVLGAILDRLPKLLKTEYKAFSIQDVKIAFERGLNGHYDNLYGVSYEVLAKWLKAYKNERMKIMKEQSNFINRQTLLIQEQNARQKKRASRRETHYAVMSMVMDYKLNGVLPEDDPGNYIYNHLDKLRLVQTSTERKKEAMTQAEVLIKQEKLSSTHNPLKLQEITKQLKNGLSKNALISKAKKILLPEIFESINLENFKLYVNASN